MISIGDESDMMLELYLDFKQYLKACVYLFISLFFVNEVKEPLNKY